MELNNYPTFRGIVIDPEKTVIDSAQIFFGFLYILYRTAQEYFVPSV